MNLPTRWPRALLAILLAGCGDDTIYRPTYDLGPDLAPIPTSDAGPPPFTLEKGGSGHGDVSASLSAGQVRAGRVTAAAQLLSGRKVAGRVGDIKLYNDKVAFIIESERASDGYAPYGGGLLDGARLLPGARGESLLGETMLGVGTKLLSPTSVGVVSDGSDGKPALVRAIGTPAPLPVLAAMLGEDLGGNPNVYLVVDYLLAPGSEVLELRFRVVNRTHAKLEIPLVALGLSSGDGVEFFADEVGFEVEKAGARSWVGMIGRDVGYAFVSPDHTIDPIIRYEGIWATSNGGLSVPAAGEAQRTYRLLLADGEPEAVKRAVRKLLGQSEPPALTGTVRDGKGAAVPAVAIHVETDATPRSYVTMARSDAQGAYQLALAPGKYLLTTVAEGRQTATTPFETTSVPAAKDLTVPGSATLQVAISDATGVPLPSKLVVKPTSGAFQGAPASYGEEVLAGGSLVRFAPSGVLTLSLPPGSYTLTASRGFEYEIDKQSVALIEGEAKSLAFKLTRSVDTTGFMCGDFHVHAMWSPDSSDLYQHKVAALAGEGLEIPVITEHEYIADLNPTIAELGLQPWIRGVIGEELTTFVYGHFNPFPITQDPTKPNMGAMLWYKKPAPTLFDDVKKTWPMAVFQVNHPRGKLMGAYFSFAGYDPKTGTASRASEWSRHFDAVEVWNSNHWDPNGEVEKDWYSFLDRGFLATATGNSDSHRAVTSEVGYPRNYVKLDVDTPAKLDLSALAKAVKEQRVVVSGGPFLSVSVGGKGLGEVAPATSKKAKIAIKVQAPTWMTVDTLRVIMGGVEAHKLTLDAKTTDPTNPVIRYNAELELLPEKDTWVIVVATGVTPMDPVSRGDVPFAVSNPIYLDVDGNGAYDPPKSF